MTKQYYECHITMEGSPEEVQEKITTSVELSRYWKFSAIHGDILLGDGLKCYLTRHFNARMDQHEVISRMHYAATLAEEAGIKVTRRKVEKVLHDDRSTKTGGCKGGCPECHLDDLKPYHAQGGYT